MNPSYKLCSLLLATFSFALIANAGTASDHNEKHIRALWEEFEVAYNAGDSTALAELWTEEGDFFSLSGGIFRGRAEIQAFWHDALSKSYEGSRFALAIDQIRLLKSDVAVVDGTWIVTGDSIPEKYPSKGIYTQVLERTNGKWRIIAARPSVPLRGHTRNHGR
jgi:uncharacterized protein (TIGR02246 family)